MKMDKIFQPPSDRVIRAGFFTTIPIAIGTSGKGTGLGLSMSYDIVTKGHGGELKVETREGEGLPGEESGSEFIIILHV